MAYLGENHFFGQRRHWGGKGLETEKMAKIALRFGSGVIFQGGYKRRKPCKEKTMLTKELLDILVCPKCKGPVSMNESKDGLVCPACRLEYEIRDGIPIMLVDEARVIE